MQRTIGVVVLVDAAARRRVEFCCVTPTAAVRG